MVRGGLRDSRAQDVRTMNKQARRNLKPLLSEKNHFQEEDGGPVDRWPWGWVAVSIWKREGEDAGNQETNRQCDQDSFLTKSLQPLPG